MAPLRVSRFCFNHDPTRGRERARARKRGGSRSRVRKADQPASVATVADLQLILGRAIADTLRLRNGVARARTLAHLVAVALRCLEVHAFTLPELKELMEDMASVVVRVVDDPSMIEQIRREWIEMVLPESEASTRR